MVCHRLAKTTVNFFIFSLQTKLSVLINFSLKGKNKIHIRVCSHHICDVRLACTPEKLIANILNISKSLSFWPLFSSYVSVVYYAIPFLNFS